MGLDGIELVMAWEDQFDISIPDKDASTLRTPRIAVDCISRLVRATDTTTPGPCLSMRAFTRFRRALTTTSSCPRSAVRPGVRLASLLPAKNRTRRWWKVRDLIGVPRSCFPNLHLGVPRATIGELSRIAVARAAQSLRDPSAPWTRSQVREVVRAIITDNLAIPEFSDDDDFVLDLRID